MTAPNDPIAPNMTQDNNVMFADGGLTKREYFSALALQGLLANQDYGYHCEDVESDAVILADRLIRELNKTKP